MKRIIPILALAALLTSLFAVFSSAEPAPVRDFTCYVFPEVASYESTLQSLDASVSSRKIYVTPASGTLADVQIIHFSDLMPASIPKTGGFVLKNVEYVYFDTVSRKVVNVAWNADPPANWDWQFPDSKGLWQSLQINSVNAYHSNYPVPNVETYSTQNDPIISWNIPKRDVYSGVRTGGVVKFSLTYLGEYTDALAQSEYERGYANGTHDGEQNAADTSLRTNLLDAINAFVSAPFTAVRNALNFEFLGFNVAGLVFFILTIALVIVVLKIFL